MHRLRCLLAVAIAALAVVPAAASAEDDSNLPTYQVGIGSESIAVSPALGTVYLGGFGLGGPTVAGPGIQDRHATGNLGVGPGVRAFVVSDGKTTFAIADAEVQGWFAANRDGATGIMDVRRKVAADLGDKLPADHIVVQSDHTHGGPDLLGVWGGASSAYRKYVVDQTVKAIEEAYASRTPGHLFYGTAANGATGPTHLINNQYDYDPGNKVMDDELRVLQARTDDGTPIATVLNLSSHADVLGSHNTLATGDWPQQTNLMLERELGGRAMTIVGTLGRSQPSRPGCPDPQGLSPEQEGLCELDTYSARVVARTQDALRNAQPLSGDAKVVANSYLITDPATSPALLGLMFGGAAIGAPLYRALTPPFLQGDVLGTPVTSVRIGDILLSAGPGEMYPQIPLKVRAAATQVTAPIKGFMTAGLADDQLGYIIAPLEAYPEPVKDSFFDSSFLDPNKLNECQASYGANCDPSMLTPTPDPIGNDNYFFNVSHTLGERLTCALLRGAGDVFGQGNNLRATDDRCAAFANDAALPEGADVTAGDATQGAPALPTIPPGSGR